MSELLHRHEAKIDKYDPAKKIWLLVAEWGTSLNEVPGTNPTFHYQQNSLRDALIAASTLNIFNNHCDMVRMASLEQMVNVLQALVLTKGESMLLTPKDDVFDLFRIHQDSKLLSLHLMEFHIMGMARIVFRRSMLPLRKTAIKQHIFFVNLDPEKSIILDIGVGDRVFSAINGKILTSGKYTDINTFFRQIISVSGHFFPLKKSRILCMYPCHPWPKWYSK